MERRCLDPPEAPLELDEDPGGRLAHVHVAYSSDLANKSANGLLTSMVSLTRHLTDPGDATIHVILPREQLALMRSVLGCYRRELAALPKLPNVTLHEMQPWMEVGKLDPRMRGEPYRRWLLKPATFTRTHLEDYLPNAPRVLWLDHDTLVKADVRPLYRMRMRQPVAAALEWCSYPMVPLPQEVFKPWCPLHYYLKLPGVREEMNRRGFAPRDPRNHVFNTGVMVLDLDKWRSQGFAKSVEELVRLSEGYEGDQAAVNIFFNGTAGVELLDWRWNIQHHLYHVFNQMPWPEACVVEARILHFSGLSKPWEHCRHTGIHDVTCQSAFFWRVLEVFNYYAGTHKCAALN